MDLVTDSLKTDFISRRWNRWRLSLLWIIRLLSCMRLLEVAGKGEGKNRLERLGMQRIAS